MKTNPYSTITAHSVKRNDSRRKSILFLLFIMLSVFAFAGRDASKPDFQHASLESSVVGTISKAGQTATLIIKPRTAGVCLEKLTTALSQPFSK